GVYIYPFRCSLCGHRFRALAWGRRYVKQSADRREWDPVAVRAPVVLRTGDASAAGEATALSFHGFTVKTEARLGEGPHAGAQPVVLVITVIVLSWLWLSPWFVRCVYGVNC